MTPERWQKVKQIFQAVLDCPPEERDAFLERACQEDHVLRGEIESLISSYDHAGTQSIEDMAAQVATEVITDEERNLMIGRKIAHYEVLSQLGRGGMGEVYLAQDSRLGRKVALKFLPANLSAEDRARKRLIKEAQAAAKLDHPNICTIYEVGQQDGLHFIAMQYVEGETLACRIHRKPLEIKEVLDIAAQVADALAEAHSRAIIHRDIKPANIMMTTRRQVKVMDFGLAKSIAQQEVMDREAQTETLLSEPGMILGTLPYMSPEQVSGEPVDARSDIFSFGVMLYEMASGHKPFAAESAAATISAILTREAAPLVRYSREAPGELERIVAKALRKDREERYQGIKDMALDLKNLKEQLEFEAKLERSRPPDVNGEGGGISTAGSRLTVATSPELPASTGETAGSKSGSGAKLFTKPVIQHKRAAVGALALVLTVSTAAFFYFNYFNRAQALTEKDTILLADIVNMTGETVFDGTLKQALEVQLGQSPFLNLFSEDRVRETLSYMGRSPDERVTKQIAREICQRQGLKALLTGSIAALGSHYVVTLEALNSQTGEAIAREQVEAESKEQVLKTPGGGGHEVEREVGRVSQFHPEVRRPG
jgi:eukaryotic-like serine/threonine-protein kinase